MTEEHFQETLDVLLDMRPFKPFTVELNTGRRIEIDHPRAVSTRGGHAIFTSPGGVLIMFDHESVNQIINAPAHSAPGKRRAKLARPKESFMNTIRIRKKLESETLHLPERHALIGKNVEIIVTEISAVPQVTPGTGDWNAAMQAVRELQDYDFDVVREQREYDLLHADDHLP